MEINGKIGFGPKVSGEAVFLSQATSHDLNFDLSEKILLLDFLPSREFLEKAGLVGVAGIVAPRIHFRDYLLLKAEGEFSLLILEKFGKVSISKESGERLEKYSGKKVSIDGEEKVLALLH